MLFFLIAPALADVVPGDMDEPCPPGAVWASTHDGGYCRPAPCPAEGAECVEGRVCRTTLLWIAEEEVDCRDITCERIVARGPCSEPGKSSGTATCVEARRCVDAPPPPPPPPPPNTASPLEESSWKSLLCATSGSAPAAIGLLGVLPLLGRRSRDDG